MSTRDDRRHERRAGGVGGDWQGVRATLENPMTWSIPVAGISGIAVRVHVFFVVFAAVILIRSAVATEGGPSLGVAMTGLLLACLFVVVLVHEFAHCLACRWSGGAPDEILLWPLGGLAFGRPPRTWRAHLATAAGGPAVNLLICLLCGAWLGMLTGRWAGVALPDPRRFDAMIASYGLGEQWSWPLTALFMINWLSLVLLLLNLLPIHPLDGGRLVHALLWPWLGDGPAQRVSVGVGYLGAIGLGLWGAVVANWMLVLLAVYGGLTCYDTHRRLAFTEAVLAGDWSDDADPDDDESLPRAPDRRAERRARACAAEDREVDRILAKIAERGMAGLDRRERRLLRRATSRRRAGEGDGATERRSDEGGRGGR